jgi:hypothetical protein
MFVDQPPAKKSNDTTNDTTNDIFSFRKKPGNSRLPAQNVLTRPFNLLHRRNHSFFTTRHHCRVHTGPTINVKRPNLVFPHDLNNESKKWTLYSALV